jgi:hypothetical protein
VRRDIFCRILVEDEFGIPKMVAESVFLFAIYGFDAGATTFARR